MLFAGMGEFIYIEILAPVLSWPSPTILVLLTAYCWLYTTLAGNKLVDLLFVNSWGSDYNLNYFTCISWNLSEKFCSDIYLLLT